MPEAVSACVERWGLSLDERLSGGHVGQVVACRTPSGEPAVLKLTPTSARQFTDPADEAAALRTWDGRGAVRLLAFDDDLGALLTSRAIPGTPLGRGDDAQAVRSVAAVLAHLHAVTADRSDFRPLGEVVEAYLERKAVAVTGAATATLPVTQAREAARDLVASTTDRALLHGDLMDKNLLLDHDCHIAIDPMPSTGDPHADIGFWAASRPPARTLLSRAGALATTLGRDPGRAQRWAAVYAVGEACEDWRPDVVDLRM